MTRLTGHTGQDKLPGSSIVTCGMTGEAFTWFFYLLQVNLENGIK
ncbi:MAG: hypothetical protein P8186_03170 [Anaerolineae bacterium]